MTDTGALIWFIATTLVVFGMLAFGTYLAVNSYERGRGVIHLHLWHRHG
jgi:hypothetical protein